MRTPVSLSVNELARYASLSARTLRSYLHHPTHPLPHFRLPGKILIRRDEFDAWIERYRVNGLDAGQDLDRLVDEILASLQ
jgi:excisionase family DNA binding protein